MAKTKISEFDTNPANNTDINSINIAEGCAPSGINNAIRQLMADLKEQQTGAGGDNFTVGGNLAVTGTSTFNGAASITSGSITGITDLAIADGGTGASTAANARTNLGTVADTATNGIAARTAANTLTSRTITASTGISISNGDGVAGNPTITNTGVTTVNGNSGNITISVLTSGTAVASTSGTFIDFTGIPSIVRRVTVMLASVSTTGTSPIMIQMGTSSGVQTSLYISAAFSYNSTSSQNATTGFIIDQGSAAGGATRSDSGQITFTYFDSSRWTSSGILTTSNLNVSSGTVNLLGTLDRIRITTINGTDTFDTGLINIMYE